ncbi:terminase large subunit [Roseomonas sp. BN140053]|uniref:terminase large subunit n=1 Tax=Roseomonas sp. BN140053 TaxID=3391898 RepID=UPI0039EBB821
MTRPTWTTSCPDWPKRIVAGRSLIPFAPLNKAEADAALDVFRSLRVVDVAGSPTFGEIADQWVLDFVAAIFGAVDESGLRLIREFLLCISKKNGKSTLAAGIMLTALIRNWRLSNELLILAPTIEAAQNSFKPAADMIRHDPELHAADGGFLHIQDHIRTITHLTTKATLKVVAADGATVVGKKAGFVLLDELWEFGKKAHADGMLREATGGLISRPEGFVISITTHSDEAPAGVWKDKLTYARKVRDGEVKDPKFLPVLYEFPPAMLKAEAYLDPTNFYVTNPNIGSSVSQEWLEDELRKEMEKGPDTRNTFLAKHLNIEIGVKHASDGWAGARVWTRGEGGPRTLEELVERSEVVALGADGGGLDDLFGFGAVGREKGTRRWLGWAHALISPEGWEIRKANRPHYEDFVREGSLTRVDGLPDDLNWIVAQVEMVKDAGVLTMLGVDPAGIGGLVEALAEIGVTEEAGTLVGIAQGFRLMNAVKTVERKLADRTLVHSGSSLLAWCAGNAKVRQTSTAMLIERAASGYGKIDPLMALFDAAAIMSKNPEAAPPLDMAAMVV